MLVEGQQVEFEADLSAVLARGIQAVVWTVSGALTMVVNGQTLVIASLPPSPGSCDISLTVTLGDGTVCKGRAGVMPVTAAVADRAQRLCELAHIVLEIPLARSRLDVLINPTRMREIAARPTTTPDVNRIVLDLQRSLEQLLRGR
jgi:hypothetical protein